MRIKLILTTLILIVFLGCKKENLPNQPPLVQFINPTTPNAYLSMEDTLNIIALAKDDDGEVKRVQFYLQGELLADDNEYPWSQQIIFEKEGEFILTLTALDNDQQTSDTAKTYVRVVDYNKADIEISVSPKYYKKENDPVTIKVNSFSNNGKILNTKVFLNDVIIAYDTVSYIAIIKDSVAAGSYEVYAIVEDESGKISRSGNVSFYVNENKPPQIKFSYINTKNLIPGSNLYVDVDVSDQDGEIDSVSFFLNDSLIKSIHSKNGFSFSLYLPKSGDYKLSAMAYDNDGASAVTEDIYFSVQEGFLPNGLITTIIPSTNDNMFFALNNSKNQLMLLYPFTAGERRIELPYSAPIDMDYSPTEEKLFIVYNNWGVVSIWDQNSEEYTTINFSNTADAISVVADVLHRRIYVETTEGFFILDLDSGNVLFTETSLEFDYYIIDTEHQLMFTAENSYGTKLKKYSLTNDNIELLQTREDIGLINLGMALNKQKNYFVVITTTGNDHNGTNYAFKTSNINELYGQFDNVERPDYTSFSRDSETMITVSRTENKFYLLDAESFQVEQNVDIRNGSNAIVAINNSKTKAVVFSHSTYETDYKMLYYKLD